MKHLPDMGLFEQDRRKTQNWEEHSQGNIRTEASFRRSIQMSLKIRKPEALLLRRRSCLRKCTKRLYLVDYTVLFVASTPSSKEGQGHSSLVQLQYSQ